ncbi:MAG: type I restriction endonuclease, partial [Candidatus Poribacteria bacterium]|nr:type I restriction endonuclease [Candidatus Poribacteria bacterium]
MPGFRFNEKYLSQIPALLELVNLGYEYLTPEQVFKARRKKFGDVLLENILRQQIKKINRINYKGREYRFSEENVQSAVQKIKNVQYAGLLKTNEAVYDLLTLGTAMEQSIEGDTKSFTLSYVDWRTPSNNAFHVTAEFPVERTRSTETARPDIVLFVNGIPFAVIECKSPGEKVEAAISQTIRNQTEEYIPRLFIYTQLLMSINKNDGRYATVGTEQKFWSLWREKEDSDQDVKQVVNTPLTEETKNALFSGDFASARRYFDELGAREITEQDRAIYSLCRPE